MKEKQELKKQLIILSIVLIVVITIAIVLNMKDRNTESYTKIKDSTSQQGDTQNIGWSSQAFHFHSSLPASLDSIKGLIRLVTIIANYRRIYKKNDR